MKTKNIDGAKPTKPNALRQGLNYSGLDLLFLLVSVLIALFALFIVYDYLLYTGVLRSALAGKELLVATILIACATAVMLYVVSNRWRLSRTNLTLQTEIAKSQTLIDSLGDGIISLSNNGIIEFVNPQTLNILSSSEQTLLGKKMTDALELQHADGRVVPEESQPFRLAFRTGKVAVSNKYFYVRPDRQRIAVAITAAPIIRDGIKIGVVQTFRDITEKKEIEKTKDDFVAMASHQLRTPLSAINWFTELLLSGDAGELNEEQKAYTQEVHDSNSRLIALVDELLDISRVDLGKFKVEPEPTDLASLASKVVGELEGQLKEKNLQVHQEYDEALPKDVPLDRRLVWIMLHNFLTNAIKYTHKGDTITVKIKYIDQEKLPIGYWAGAGKSILMSVSDNGLGIPKHQQDKIFTKLFRADNAAVSTISGNGLGLYLVKAIVEQIAGKLWFESEINKGTTFYVNMSHEGMKATTLGDRQLSESAMKSLTTPRDS